MSKFSFGRLKKNASRAEPAQKLIIFIFILFIIGLVYYLWPQDKTLNKNDIENYTDTKSKALVGGFNVRDNSDNYSVIEDPTTPQGKMALAADKERVLRDQKDGKSSIAAFSQDNPEPKGTTNGKISGEDVRENLRKALANLKSKPDEKRDTSWIDNKSVPPVIKDKKPVINVILSEEEKMMQILENIPADQLAEIMNNYRSEAQSKLMALARTKATVEKGNSGGFKRIPMPDETIADVQTQSEGNTLVSKSNGDSSETEDEFSTFIPQGAKLSAYSGRPIDSRFDKNFILTVDYGGLEGATLSCQYTRSNDYLVPSCSDITFERQTVSIVAAVLNPDTMSAIINQSKDSETLLKTLSLLVTGTAAVYGENKFAQGTTVSSNDTTVVQEKNLSDSELIAGAATTVIGTLSSEAMRYFMEDDIINIKPNESMIITLLQPIKAPWITSKPLISGVDYL